jgi:hypothetical protein
MVNFDARVLRANLAAGVLALSTLVVPAVALATPVAGLFYERTVMREADGRCHLFSPAIAAALNASSLQAHGAALRAGVTRDVLAATADRARDAAYRVPCASRDIAAAADRVKQAFAGYERMTWMNFPGETATWQAERKPTAPVVNRKAVDGPRWRLSEPGQWDGAASGALTLGLTADAAPVVVSGALDSANAFTAVLVVRDPSKLAEPWIDPRRRDLASRTPPHAATRAFVASARESAPASLMPGGQGRGMKFAFSPAAAEALAGLDPREAVSVEFGYSNGPTRRAVFEVGDFAAGRAFLMAGR